MRMLCRDGAGCPNRVSLVDVLWRTTCSLRGDTSKVKKASSLSFFFEYEYSNNVFGEAEICCGSFRNACAT